LAVIVAAPAILQPAGQGGVPSPRRPAHTSGAERREVALPIRNFLLTDQNGRSFELNDIKGKIVIVTFAYTSCPDVCPLLTAAMRRVQERLSASERADVHFLTITTDPEIDTPAILARYAQQHGADLSNWAFLTGAEGALRPVWKNFGVGVRRLKRGLVDHTPLTALIDRSGIMRVAFQGTAPAPDAMLRDLRLLLAR
jgi:protein SCO1/2